MSKKVYHRVIKLFWSYLSPDPQGPGPSLPCGLGVLEQPVKA